MRTATYLAEARTDAQDRLIEAAEPLAGLQHRCGGDMPGVIAIPELLALVRKSRTQGLRIARMFHAIDGQDRIKVWAEIAPDLAPPDARDRGCVIRLANWQTSPLPAEDREEIEQRQRDIESAAAELTARLDSEQRPLTAECTAPDLASLLGKLLANPDRPWTEFVEFAGSAHRQPLHWRLLDGAICMAEGSDRQWQVSLRPLGLAEPGSAGFELCLIAEAPYAKPARSDEPAPDQGIVRSIGRDLSPVLRQPIARIIANAETIRSRLAGPLADQYSDYAADIASAGQHLLALIDDLSDMEIVESDSFTTAPDLIDLADVARRAAGILGVRAKEKNITLRAPADDEAIPATAEFRRVLQVLLNLVGNAINYSDRGSEVWITLAAGEGRVSVTVADNGPGLTADQQAVVFEKFERLGRSGDGGSGLGLYISRRIARAMGGDLTVDSTPGEGARFILKLPGTA